MSSQPEFASLAAEEVQWEKPRKGVCEKPTKYSVRERPSTLVPASQRVLRLC